MKQHILQSALVCFATLFSAGVLAHGNVQCPAHPKEEWRDHNELYRKLQTEGWEVRRMEATPTCYEVYARDRQGKRVEAFFDPKTFERIE